jgi:hypothetical protein
MTNRELAQAIRDALNSANSIPVPLRSLVAGTLMCARGGAPSKLGMSKVGNYSYGSSQNHYAELLVAIVDQLPRVVAEMASGEIDPVTAARLRDELKQRDDTVRDLRRDLANVKQRHEELRRYALALHERLAEVEAQTAAGTGAAIRTLHPVL